MFRSGAGPVISQILPQSAKTFDGLSASGIWVRVSAAAQRLEIEAW